MVTTDKKLEKLQKLLEMANEDYVTPDDLIQMSEGLLGIINAEKTRVNKAISDGKDEDEQAKQDLVATLDRKEQAVKHLISELGRAYADNDNIISAQFSKEVKRLEKKIPTKTDLTEINAIIESLQRGLASFPTELTINNEAVRDGLELLEGDERLDKSAINGLEEWYAEILALASKKNTVAGARLLRYMADVAIDNITNGQTLVWNATLGRFEPGSGGSGSGHTIEDEGTPLTQRAALNFVGAGVTVTDVGAKTTVTIPSSGGMVQETPTGTVNGTNVTFTVTVAPKFIVTDTGFYIAGFGYTLATLTVTMDLAPNSFIRAYS